MDIGNALRRTGKEGITTRSIISKIIQDTYPSHVEIQSVKVHGNKIIIKTGNALINSELSMLSGQIKKASLQKLHTMGVKLSESVTFHFI